MLKDRMIKLVAAELAEREALGVAPLLAYELRAKRTIDRMSNLEFIDLLDEALAMGVQFGTKGTIVP